MNLATQVPESLRPASRRTSTQPALDPRANWWPSPPRVYTQTERAAFRLWPEMAPVGYHQQLKTQKTQPVVKSSSTLPKHLQFVDRHGNPVPDAPPYYGPGLVELFFAALPTLVLYTLAVLGAIFILRHML